ncbi:E3 ubiquitin-protein ligase ZNF598-like [Teleopsis dalmanni]|uniref:E3 ubiquitin-protein ligase ZNF598-like n=1 Tax=Teleopsis dalmanni TaxID=139649 RepID=UPI0018CF954B|nr:E3 ubiquitin-protein ligase ZNF598-like [Teleopsis dalmanni]XP_037958318.1 E3 ubiquitin-protein ligase ZNF598-like [Teleopsis dalmanni]
MDGTNLLPLENDVVVAEHNNIGNNCPVCLNEIKIYSIPNCNHPLCLDCATRMKFLHNDNCCPLCRGDICFPLITDMKGPYNELKTTHFDTITYSHKHKVQFLNKKVKNVFHKMTDHKCPKCTARPFESFVKLRSHMAAIHKLHYCELCINYIDMFSNERKYYSKEQLVDHNENGDEGDLTEGGHPTCVFCAKRFFGINFLFLHSLVCHYYCSLCAEQNEYVVTESHEDLVEHIDRNHFPCLFEECDKIFPTVAHYLRHMDIIHSIEPQTIYPQKKRKNFFDITQNRISKYKVIVDLSQREILENWTKPTIQGDYEISRTKSTQTTESHQMFDIDNEMQFPPLGCKSRDIKKKNKQCTVPVPYTCPILTNNGESETATTSKPTYAEVALSFGSKF